MLFYGKTMLGGVFLAVWTGMQISEASLNEGLEEEECSFPCGIRSVCFLFYFTVKSMFNGLLVSA